MSFFHPQKLTKGLEFDAVERNKFLTVRLLDPDATLNHLKPLVVICRTAGQPYYRFLLLKKPLQKYRG
jgi:hypothetical protein